nr:MAG TPA: hypothetical protein [Caudoviricetes sp.]
MRGTAQKSLPTQKNTKLYDRHRLPCSLVFIWCFNLLNGRSRSATIHTFESNKRPQYGTFLNFPIRYGSNQ